MYLPRTSCIICGEYIAKIIYNLKTTNSKSSKVLMINLVEKLYKNVFLLHCNICSGCHDLLNELDAVQQREKELYLQLKKHIAKLGIRDEKGKEHNPDRMPADHNKTFSDHHNDIKIPDVDLTLLPIKVKRIPCKDTSHSNPITTTKPGPVSKSRSEKAANEKAFEQIQTSIQMDLSKHVEEYMNKCKPTKCVLCEICGHSFRTMAGYENHMKKHDNIEDEMKLLALNKVQNTWFCERCGKTFNQKGALMRHLPIHTGETRYQCEECGKKFLHHSSFNMHRKIHAGQRNYKCEVCNYCFLTNSHLKRHLRSAHEKEKNHICLTCGKKFGEKYNLLAHMKLVHKENEYSDYSESVQIKTYSSIYYQVQEEVLEHPIEEGADPVLYDL